MQILTTNDLPAIWEGDEGGYKANDLARPIAEEVGATAQEVELCMAQLGTADDLTPEARAIAVQLRHQLALAKATSDALMQACRPA